MWRMSKGVLEWARGGKFCSYKRVTISICLFNLLAAIYVLRNLYVFSSYPSEIWHAIDQATRAEESAVVRRALGPVELFRLKVEKLRANTQGEVRVLELSKSVKRKLADEILQRLRVLGDGANLTEQREALGLWHAEKLKTLKLILPISKEGSSMDAKEAKMLASALESEWVSLLEDIGLWIPSVVKNHEINDRPENATEYEDAVPGPSLSPECHAEPHTDYDGAAIRWGLTHHKATAADCCQACINQANNAKVGQIKCNIWVYCPSEFGCYSPDIYEHRYQECWLKQAKKPRLNFKDKYSETYRDSHPTAPVAVPWISGVISS